MNSLPRHVAQQVSITALLSTECQPLVSTIRNELGEALSVLDNLPTKEWMIAGGFMAFIAGHTKCYGSIDVFFYKSFCARDLGSDWTTRALLRSNSWLYDFDDEERFAGQIKGIIYGHKNLRLRLIVPELKFPKKLFVYYCSDILMRFDIDYCKLGWLGTTKQIIDLRGFSKKFPLNHIPDRIKKFERRLVNKQLPVPKLSLLSYLKCIEDRNQYYVIL